MEKEREMCEQRKMERRNWKESTVELLGKERGGKINVLTWVLSGKEECVKYHRTRSSLPVPPCRWPSLPRLLH
jgi:hypothetical protein